MDPQKLGYEERFHFNNSSNQGTMCLTKSKKNTNAKVSFTPTPKTEEQSHMDMDINIKSFDKIIERQSNEIDNCDIQLKVPAHPKSLSTKNEKSKSLTNIQHIEKEKTEMKKKSNPDDHYLEYFDQNYEDLVNSIQSSSEKNSEFTEFDNSTLKSRHYKTFSNKRSEAKVMKTAADSSLENLVSKAEEEMKGLTNTEDISNFYEYTEDCMKRILKLKVTPKEEIQDMMITLPFENEISIQNKRLAVFDLDETLIHCQVKNPKQAQQMISVTLPSKIVAKVGVNIRPHWKEALREIKNYYFIIVYTASHQSYADSVLDFLDPDKEFFQYRLYRHNCVKVPMESEFIYVKDLRIFKNISPQDMIIIDNSVLSFAFQLENGIPIMPYYDSKEDVELVFLAYFLNAVAKSPDLRTDIKQHVRLEYFLQKAREETEDTNEESSKTSITTESPINKGTPPVPNSSTASGLISLNICTEGGGGSIIEEKRISENENDETKPAVKIVAAKPMKRKIERKGSIFQDELHNSLEELKIHFRDFQIDK